MVTPTSNSVSSQTEKSPENQVASGSLPPSALPARSVKSDLEGVPSPSVGNPRPTALTSAGAARPTHSSEPLKNEEIVPSNAQVKLPKGVANEVSPSIRPFIDAFDKFRKQHNFNTLFDLIDALDDKKVRNAEKDCKLLKTLFGDSPDPQVLVPERTWRDLISALGTCYSQSTFSPVQLCASSCYETSIFLKGCYPKLSEWLSSRVNTKFLDELLKELAKHIVLFAQSKKRIPLIYSILLFDLYPNVDVCLLESAKVTNNNVSASDAPSVFKFYKRYYIPQFCPSGKAISIDHVVPTSREEEMVYRALDWLFGMAECTKDDYIPSVLITNVADLFKIPSLPQNCLPVAKDKEGQVRTSEQASETQAKRPATEPGAPSPSTQPVKVNVDPRERAWQKARFENEFYVVVTTILNIVNLFVPPRLLKSENDRKIVFSVYVKEDKKYIEHSLSLNFDLFLSVCQHINRLSKAAVLSKICEPDGVHYKFEASDLPYASSDLMYGVLCCVCDVKTEPEFYCDDVVYENTTFVEKGQSDAKFKFREDTQPRAFNLMPGVDAWPVQPINEFNFTKAINKRYLNRYQPLDQYELNQTKASIQNELASSKTHVPGIIFYKGCFEDYVEKLHQKKHLTVGQSKEFLAYAAVCEQYLSESVDQVLIAFLSTLQYDTKSFVKDEVDTIETTLRFITSPSNFIKVLLGPIFEAIDDCLFFANDAMFKDCHIKGKDPLQVKEELMELNNYAAVHLLKFLQTDISAFEASQCTQAQELEFMYYFHFAQHDKLATCILKGFKAFLSSQSTCYNKYYSITHGPMRLSGLNNTSTGNWLLNHINCEHIIARRAHITIHKRKYEGDDGLLCVSAFVTPSILEQYSVFPLTFVESNNLFDLSFCGWHLDANGNRRVDDPGKFYSKIVTYFSRKEPTQREAYEYVTLRLFSAQCMYPFDPCVETMVSLRDQYFHGVNLEVRKRTYDRYMRENWFKFGGFKIPYLENYNDASGNMIRLSDHLDSYNPYDFSVLNNLKFIINEEKEQFIRSYSDPGCDNIFTRFVRHCQSRTFILIYWLMWVIQYYIESVVLFNLGLKTFDNIVPSPCSYKLFNLMFRKVNAFTEAKNYYRIRQRFGVDLGFDDQLSGIYHRILKHVDNFLNVRMWRDMYIPSLEYPLNKKFSEDDIQHNLCRVLLHGRVNAVVANVAKINTLYQLYSLNLKLVDKEYVRDFLPAAFDAINGSDNPVEAQMRLEMYVDDLMDKLLVKGLPRSAASFKTDKPKYKIKRD